MKQLPSHDFRKTYARLSEPVEVTSNGHVIGVYWPNGTSIGNTPPLRDLDALRASGLSDYDIARMSQKDRDAILRRVSKSS